MRVPVPVIICLLVLSSSVRLSQFVFCLLHLTFSPVSACLFSLALSVCYPCLCPSAGPVSICRLTWSLRVCLNCLRMFANSVSFCLPCLHLFLPCLHLSVGPCLCLSVCPVSVVCLPCLCQLTLSLSVISFFAFLVCPFFFRLFVLSQSIFPCLHFSVVL